MKIQGKKYHCWDDPEVEDPDGPGPAWVDPGGADPDVDTGWAEDPDGVEIGCVADPGDAECW